MSVFTTHSITKTTKYTFKHIWKIEDFKTVPRNVECILSPNFPSPNKDQNWKLKLKPYVLNGEQEYIGIHLFLRYSASLSRLRATYKLSIMDNNNIIQLSAQCSSSSGRIFEVGGEGHGFNHVALRSHLNTLLDEIDMLNVECEITCFGNLNTQLLPKINNIIYSEFDYTEGSIANDFKHLNEDYDFVILCDGAIFNVHSLVLKARSKVFQLMLDRQWEEKRLNQLVIHDFNADVIRAMVIFLYSDNIEICILKDVAFDLLIAADKYDLPKLKKICEQCIASHLLKPENLGNLLKLADFCNCEKLKEIVLENIASNAEIVAESQEFEKHIGKRQYLYSDIFKVLTKKQRVN
ncbi:Protein roadkill-like protein [Leptotrombidium deliense]|uniref:Protein roadkill-like protein n=1 Tax=Leptotrombidium deliense TaxID=299467 RepID=A0A443RX15_9ACAR|nr:Protein roadkill-like protein [Leptotrombidium deliense]